MDRRRKNIVVGIITSFFGTPLIGGALVGYLNGPDSHEILRSGFPVGMGIGLILASLVTFLFYSTGAFRSLELTANYLAVVGVLFFGSILLAMLGAGLGNALASRSPGRG